MIADEVDVEFEALQQLPVSKLHERFESIYGETPRSRNKVWLIRKILWRIQSLKEGGLSERALLRATELTVDADVRLMPATKPHAQKAKSSEESRQTPTASKRGCSIDSGTHNSDGDHEAHQRILSKLWILVSSVRTSAVLRRNSFKAVYNPRWQLRDREIAISTPFRRSDRRYGGQWTIHNDSSSSRLERQL